MAQRTAAEFGRRGLHVVSVDDVAPLLVRKLFLGLSFLRAIRQRQPSVIVYIPSQSATIGTYLRSFVLRLTVPCRVILVAAQPGRIPLGEKVWGRWIGPDLCLSPSPVLIGRLRKSRIRSGFLPMGVDVPESRDDPSHALDLRLKYELPAHGPLLLHVGHLSARRNIEWLVRLRRELDVNVVVATSPTMWRDEEIVRRLSDAGVVIIDRYIEEIGELYQASDCYVFPVLDPNGAIGVPLSVLEAMICNLPVVSTRFGGLPDMFPSAAGLIYADDENLFLAGVRQALSMDRLQIDTGLAVKDFTWDRIADRLLDDCRRIDG